MNDCSKFWVALSSDTENHIPNRRLVFAISNHFLFECYHICCWPPNVSSLISVDININLSLSHLEFQLLIWKSFYPDIFYSKWIVLIAKQRHLSCFVASFYMFWTTQSHLINSYFTEFFSKNLKRVEWPA